MHDELSIPVYNSKTTASFPYGFVCFLKTHLRLNMIVFNLLKFSKWNLFPSKTWSDLLNIEVKGFMSLDTAIFSVVFIAFFFQCNNFNTEENDTIWSVTFNCMIIPLPHNT